MRQELRCAGAWRAPLLALLLCAVLLPGRAQPELRPFSIEQETDIPILLRFVREGSEEEQWQALNRLRRLQDPNLVETLLAELQNPESDSRVVAARVLGMFRERRAINPLLAALNEDDNILRQAAVEALGRLRDPHAVKPLIVLLADKDTAVRKAAVTSLGNLRDPRAVEPLLAAFRNPQAGVGAECVQSLGYIGDPRAVETLLDALMSADADVRIYATIAFQSILDERAVEPLIAAATDPESSVRHAALNALKCYPEADTRQVLIRALADPEPDVQMAAMMAIRQGADDIYDLHYWHDAVEPLIACLVDRDLDMRFKAASILGRLGDRRAVEPLCMLLEEPDDEIINVVLESLWQLRDPRAIEPILKLIDRPRTDLFWAAFSILTEQGDLSAIERLLARLLESPETDYGLIEGTANSLGQRAVPLLATALEREEEPERRRTLAGLLSDFADPRALEVFLADAEQREDFDIRRNAFDMLAGYTDDPRVRDILLAAITDENQEIRRVAFDSLMSFSQDARVMPALLAAFHGEDKELRRMAAECLCGLNDPRSLESLFTLRADPDVGMRGLLLEHIIQRLPQEERSLEMLFESVNDTDNNVRTQAYHALAEWYARYTEDRERIFTALSGKLDDADPAVRRHAATALGTLDDIRALEPLLAALRDEKAVVRLNAAVALGNLGDDRAVEPLCRQLGDRYESARTAAKRALAQLGEPRAIPALVWKGLRELRSERNLRETTRALQRLGYPSGRRGTPAPPRDEFLMLMIRSRAGNASGRQALAELKEPANYEKLLALARGEFVIPDSRYYERERYERLAIETLGRIGAVEPLVALFDRSKLTSQCRTIIQELMRFHDPRIIPCLITGLRCEEEPWERVKFVEALVVYDDPRVAAALRQAMANEPENEVREVINVALAGRGDEEAFGILLRDAEDQQEYRVIVPLGGTGDPRALEKLLPMLHNQKVAYQAISGLAAFLEAARDPADYERAVEAALPLIEGEEEAAFQLLRPMARRQDRRATAPLLRLLKNSPAWIFEENINLLVATGDPAALPPLLELLNDGLIQQRVSVANAFSACADPRAITALIDALQAAPTPVRLQSVASLGRLQSREALAVLTAASKGDTSARVRAAAAEALAAINESSLNPVPSPSGQ